MSIEKDQLRLQALAEVDLWKVPQSQVAHLYKVSDRTLRNWRAEYLGKLGEQEYFARLQAALESREASRGSIVTLNVRPWIEYDKEPELRAGFLHGFEPKRGKWLQVSLLGLDHIALKLRK